MIHSPTSNSNSTSHFGVIEVLLFLSSVSIIVSLVGNLRLGRSSEQTSNQTSIWRMGVSVFVYLAETLFTLVLMSLGERICHIGF